MPRRKASAGRLAAWLLARKMSAVGAGIAIVVQGLAILLIDLQFAAVASP